MNRFLVYCFAILLIVFSCKKKENAKDDLMQEFVTNQNQQSKKFQNSTIAFQNSMISGNNEITMRFSSALSLENLEPQLVKSAISDMMIQIIRSQPKNLKLLNQGVNFRIQLFGKDGEKISEEIVNKSSMSAQKPSFSQNEKHQQLNQLLEISNSSLPKVDEASGVTITKVYVGNNRDVIYIAEVPDSLSELIKTEENRNIIKKNMSKDTAFKKMVSQLRHFDIMSVKYRYQSKSGKKLQEIEVAEKDFK